MDLIVIPNQFSEPFLLFRSLNGLSHEAFEALMVGIDAESGTEYVLPPFLHGFGNCVKLTDIGGSCT